MTKRRDDIDPTRIEMLASIGCTVEEIAAVEKCCKTTLEKRFMESINAGRLQMSASVKRKQYEIGITNGDKTMLIWLGKQYCGQRDHFDSVVDHTHRYYMEGPEKTESADDWQQQYSPEPKSPTMQ